MEVGLRVGFPQPGQTAKRWEGFRYQLEAGMECIHEIIATYARHGWRLRRALVKPETRDLLKGRETEVFEDVPVEDSSIDALWFARPSHAGREAWELRLVSETPYALFETFEADEVEEDREEVRREMEARLAEYAKARL